MMCPLFDDRLMLIPALFDRNYPLCELIFEDRIFLISAEIFIAEVTRICSLDLSQYVV